MGLPCRKFHHEAVGSNRNFSACYQLEDQITDRPQASLFARLKSPCPEKCAVWNRQFQTHIGGESLVRNLWVFEMPDRVTPHAVVVQKLLERHHSTCIYLHGRVPLPGKHRSCSVQPASISVRNLREKQALAQKRARKKIRKESGQVAPRRAAAAK